MDQHESLGLKPHLVSNALINAAAVLEKSEEQILPAVYAYVGASFGATPAQLGYITLCRALTQALSAPLGGIAGYYLHRGRVLGAGCLLWATATALFSLCSSLSAGASVWAVNGLGLALVIPTSQSLTADYYPPGSRGKAFGTLWLSASLGGMVGGLFATNIGSYQPLGVSGWRVAFFVMALVSALTGLLNLVFTRDPRRPKQQRQQQEGHQQQQQQQQQQEEQTLQAFGTSQPEKLDWGLLSREVLCVIRIPTFLIIVLQGIAGSIPWSAMVFFTLYFQLLGMSSGAASGLVATFTWGIAVGGLLGGWIGDAAAARWPGHGRIAVTQFSVLTGIPFSILLLKGLPLNNEPGTIALYAAVLLVGALLKAWPAPACNNPLFAEIVPASQRNLIYAFDRCFEGAIAACAAPLVGLLASKAGYRGAGTVTHDRDVDLKNAKALGNAMLAFMLVPWCLTLLLYTGLHYTYPRDRQAALSDLLKQPHPPVTPPTKPCGPGKGLSEEEQLLGSSGGRYSVEGVHVVEYEADQQELQRLFPDDHRSLHHRSLTEGQ